MGASNCRQQPLSPSLFSALSSYPSSSPSAKSAHSSRACCQLLLPYHMFYTCCILFYIIFYYSTFIIIARTLLIRRFVHLFWHLIRAVSSFQFQCQFHFHFHLQFLLVVPITQRNINLLTKRLIRFVRFIYGHLMAHYRIRHMAQQQHLVGNSSSSNMAHWTVGSWRAS